MVTRTTLRRNQSERISDRMLNTRSQWSRDERERRAQMARKRQAALWSLLTAPAAEPEIWAVGAATAPDVTRLEN